MSDIITRYGMEIDLSKPGHVACPKCRSVGQDRAGNNLYVYENKSYRCFSCGFNLPSADWLEENGLSSWDYEKENLVGLEFDSSVLEQIKEEYEFIETSYRGIRPDIYKYFGVMHKVDENGELCEQIYPTFVGKNIKGFKRRGLPKQFLTPYGETGADVDFFGQFRFLNSNAREVVITAGEIDMLSAYQMLKDYRDRSNKVKNSDYPYTAVVSSTIGESGTATQCKEQYDWLNSFDKIIICMDNDKAGKEAVERISTCVPKNKLFVMNLSLKDSNEYLTQSKESQFVDAFFKASPYVPVGVLGSTALSTAIREHAMIEKIPLPPFMHVLQKLMAGGIPLGVIVNLISSSGTGKSTIVEEIIYHWVFHSPYKIGILSLESDSGEYGTKMLSRHVGRKINLIETVEEKLEFLNSDFVVAKERELFFTEDGMDRFILVDDRDGDVESIQKTVEAMIVKSDCKVIVTDPLQDILACLPDDKQNEFMSWQKGMTKSHKVTFFNVNHTKKSLTGGGAGSQGVDLVEEDSHGSSSIYKSGACNLLFSRDKEAEDYIVRNTTILKMSKCRWTGNTSPFAGKYFYDNATHTIWDYDDYMSRHPELATGF